MVNADLDPASLRYGADGLLPVVVQDIASGAVLMLAHADREAVERTLATGAAHFFSRSRQALWRKGETSGNELVVRQALADCDGDTLLLRVDPRGPACHRGTRTCFDRGAGSEATAGVDPALELGWLGRIVAERRDADAQSSYTARLFSEGASRIAQKVGEEAVETVVAALDGSAPARVASEAADLLYHLVVLLAAREVPLAAVADELRRRHAERTAGGAHER